MTDDYEIENIREWQKHPTTIRLRRVLEAKLIETQQQYAAANSIDQYRYLSGVEIGYERAIEAVDNLQEPFHIEMIQVPVIVKPEKKK